MEKAVQTPAAEEAPGPSGSKTHSLPSAPSSSSAALPEPGSAKKDKEKKFSRFAKKKWIGGKRRGVWRGCNLGNLETESSICVWPAFYHLIFFYIYDFCDK